MLILSAAALAALVPATQEVVVTANGTPRPVIETGQSVAVLDAETIRTRQTPLVSDLLATTPGVTVTRNGGPGTATAVRIRGAEGDQTLTLVDGVRVNDPSTPGGGFDFGNLLAGNVSRIEVLRGPNSVIWGSQALGGVVDVRTVQPGEAFAVDVRAEYGSRDTGQAIANVSGGLGGDARFALGALHYRTDGISAAAGGRERDGFRNTGANAKLLVPVGPVTFDLRGYYALGKVEVDGFPAPTFALADTNERQRTRQLLGYAGANLDLLDGRLRGRLAITHADTDRRNTAPGTVPEVTFRGQGRLRRYEAQAVFDAADALTLIAGGELERSRLRTASPSSFDPAQVADRGRTGIDSVYGQAVVRPIAGLAVTGGVRRDDHRQFGGETTFGGNFAWTPGQGGTTLRGTYAEGFKAPTLFQLQGDFGNAALQPERARSFDLGVEQRLLDGRASLSATVFRRRTRDQIDFVSCFGVTSAICVGRPFGTYDNFARTRAKGFELAAGLRPLDGLEVQAQYSSVDTENQSAGTANFGRELARRPRHAASLAADYALPGGPSAGLTLRHAGRSFDDGGNRNRLGAYTLVDLRAAVPITAALEVYGRLENALDEDYRTVLGYGTLGRAGHLGVRARF